MYVLYFGKVSHFTKVDYSDNQSFFRLCCVGKPAIAGYVLQTPLKKKTFSDKLRIEVNFQIC